MVGSVAGFYILSRTLAVDSRDVDGRRGRNGMDRCGTGGGGDDGDAGQVKTKPSGED
jgi:hypothetical protein